MDALILAGGKSTRMHGRHKGGLLINDKKFTEILVNEMNRIAENVWISYGAEIHEFPEKCEVVMDIYKDCGPIGGLYAGLSGAKSEDICVVACDMPFMKAEFFAYLKDQMEEETDAIIPFVGERIHPLASIYRKRVLPILEEQIVSGNYKLRKMFEKMNVKYVKIEAENMQEMLKNINTLEEYEALKFSEEMIDK